MVKGTGGFLRPQQVIEELNIEKGMKIADFGCGAGYFTIPLAEQVGEEGKVYALDVLKTALESVRGRAKQEGLLNIQTIWSDLEAPQGSKLKDQAVDLVLVANILFQSSKKDDIFKEANRVLKKGKRMVVIEWKKNQPMGPPEKLVVDKKTVQSLAEQRGFKFKKEFSASKNHWGMIFEK